MKREMKQENKFMGAFPDPEFQFHDNDTTRGQFNILRELINKDSSEKILDAFITKNPAVLTTALHSFKTGNHKGWVLSKQALTPRVEHAFKRGMIPDFILGGQSSDGQEWWIVELKGANENLFSIGKNGKIGFSDVINKGVFQLLEYIDYASENQAFLRDHMKLKNFREPNGLIIAGRESEFQDERKQKLKASWNRLHKGKLEIRTYDWLIREFEHALHRRENWEKEQENLSNSPQGKLLFDFLKRGY